MSWTQIFADTATRCITTTPNRIQQTIELTADSLEAAACDNTTRNLKCQCNNQLYLMPTLKIETDLLGRSDQRPSRSTPIFLSLLVSDSNSSGGRGRGNRWRDAAGRNDTLFFIFTKQKRKSNSEDIMTWLCSWGGVRLFALSFTHGFRCLLMCRVIITWKCDAATPRSSTIYNGQHQLPWKLNSFETVWPIVTKFEPKLHLSPPADDYRVKNEILQYPRWPPTPNWNLLILQ